MRDPLPMPADAWLAMCRALRGQSERPIDPLVWSVWVPLWLSPSGSRWERMNRWRQQDAKRMAGQLLVANSPSKKLPKFTRPVSALYIRRRRAGPENDDDNLAFSFKPWGDAMTRLGIIQDDKPKWLSLNAKCDVARGGVWGTSITLSLRT